MTFSSFKSPKAIRQKHWQPFAIKRLEIFFALVLTVVVTKCDCLVQVYSTDIVLYSCHFYKTILLEDKVFFYCFELTLSSMSDFVQNIKRVGVLPIYHKFLLLFCLLCRVVTDHRKQTDGAPSDTNSH